MKKKKKEKSSQTYTYTKYIHEQSHSTPYSIDYVYFSLSFIIHIRTEMI